MKRQSDNARPSADQLCVSCSCAITLFESYYEKKFLAGPGSQRRRPTLDEDNLDYDFDEDPSMSDLNDIPQGTQGEISTVKFEELVKSFPDLQTSTSTQILNEVRKLKKELEEVKRQVREGSVGPEVKKED